MARTARTAQEIEEDVVEQYELSSDQEVAFLETLLAFQEDGFVVGVRRMQELQRQGQSKIIDALVAYDRETSLEVLLGLAQRVAEESGLSEKDSVEFFSTVEAIVTDSTPDFSMGLKAAQGITNPTVAIALDKWRILRTGKGSPFTH